MVRGDEKGEFNRMLQARTFQPIAKCTFCCSSYTVVMNGSRTLSIKGNARISFMARENKQTVNNKQIL